VLCSAHDLPRAARTRKIYPDQRSEDADGCGASSEISSLSGTQLGSRSVTPEKLLRIDHEGRAKLDGYKPVARILGSRRYSRYPDLHVRVRPWVDGRRDGGTRLLVRPGFPQHVLNPVRDGSSLCLADPQSNGYKDSLRIDDPRADQPRGSCEALFYSGSSRYVPKLS
jgi:hypothetical protein